MHTVSNPVSERKTSGFVKLVVGTALMGIVAASAFWVGASKNDRGGEKLNDSSQFLVVVEKLEALEAKVAALQSRSAFDRRETSAPTELRAAPAPGEMAETLEEHRAEQRESAVEQYESLESTFGRERVDSDWAPNTERQIEETVAKFEGTKMLGYSCKSSMCRVEVEFDDRDARETFESEHIAMAPFSNTHVWMQRFPSEDGATSRMVMMVSREGALPLR